MFKKRIIGLVILMMMLLFFCIVGVRAIIRENKRVLCEGTIKKYNEYNLGVEYYIGEEKYLFRTIDTLNNYQEGDTIEIAYYKDNPTSIDMSPTTNVFKIVIFFIICGAIVISSFCYRCIWYYRLPKKGEKIEVEYIDTIKVMSQYFSCYEMKFKWIDEKTGEEYIFINDDIIDIDPRILIQEKGITKFDAYIYKKNPNRYNRVMVKELLKNVHVVREFVAFV